MKKEKVQPDTTEEVQAKKLKYLQSVQSFSPVREVKDGVICLKDGRYIKLLEFSPVNFNLRGADEQAQIINQFAMVLRTLPGNPHFKVVQRKADVRGVLSVLNDHLNQEESAKCQRLIAEQMDMIAEVGSHTGVSRRFFVSFEYEELDWGAHKAPTWDKIVRDLTDTELSIRNSMEACGNECLTPLRDNKWVLETLYYIFARGQADFVPYSTREFSTVARYASEEGYDFENHNYVLPTNDLICPICIDDSASPNYIKVQGSEDTPPLYYTFAYIPGSDYPKACLAGWLNMLINTSPGIDVDIYAHQKDPDKTARVLSFTIRSKRATAKHADDSRSDYDELIESIGSGFYLKQAIASNEDLYDFGIMVTITGYSPEELNERFQMLRQHLGKRELGLKRLSFQMVEAFKMSLPLASPHKGIFAKMKRNIVGSQLASIYPFTSYEMSDSKGILLGSQDNGSLVLLDNFDTSKYNNANMAILGSSGAGKTYLLQCMALRFRAKQIQTFVIAPDKGHEFKRACDAVSGEFITISPGSDNNINIMDIRKRDTTKTVLLDGEDMTTKSVLAEKVQSLHTFVSLLLPDISYEEKQALDEALMQTYAKFGITLDNESLDDPDNPGCYRQMPLLGDLHECLKEIPEAKRLYQVLTRYVSGSAASFNRPTNVNLDNKYVVLDVSRLSKEMLPVGMFIALDYVWDKAREDRTAKKVIMMDEGWKLVGESASELAAQFAIEVFRVIRGYGGSAILATQDLGELMSKAGDFGSAILNNSKIKILMKTERKEAEFISKTLGLTATERENIIATKKGSGLLIANTDHVFIRVQASKTEHNLITTDRNDLSKLAQEKALEATLG